MSSTAVQATPTPAAATSAGQCALARTGDLIVWTRTAQGSTAAAQLGSIDLAQCRQTADTEHETAEQTVQLQPGFCEVLAPAAANPGYNVDAVPPARPKAPLWHVGTCS